MIPDKLLTNARLFANRKAAFQSFKEELTGGTIAEVGVYEGDNSQYLYDLYQPKHLYLLDLYAADDVFNRRFTPETHFDFVSDRFKYDRVSIHKGNSWDQLATLKDGILNFAYIDAGHGYPAVSNDIDAVLPKMKSGGIIGFNDYIVYDHILKISYGIVQAVDEMLAEHEFEVIAFALHPQGFNDIYIRVS